MPRFRAFLLAASLVAALSAGPLAAGVVFQVETTYHSGPAREPETTEMSVEGANLKMETVPGARDSSRGEAIFRGGSGEMVVVDHDDKSYLVIDAETVDRLGSQIGGQMAAMMEQVQKQLEQIDDPAMRARMEQMLKQQMGSREEASLPATEYRDSGHQATVAGYPCVKYDVFVGGQKTQELWVTDWSNVEGGAEVRDTFVEMAKLSARLRESLEESMDRSLFGAADNPADAFARVGGFPVVTRSFEGGELESESTLRSALRRTLDPGEFEPPEGYKRRSMLGGS
ncbi:MAG: hypothetical protein R3325_12635 [Thermoanaerobaculia bacterium]|nr:hypothetical protein [Thermoanaerobaculia bacterium]